MPSVNISPKVYEKLKEISRLLVLEEDKAVEWLIERFYEIITAT